MSFATHAKPKEKALDAEVREMYLRSTETHHPDRPAYSHAHGRGWAKWACSGCDYWTGYMSRTKANRAIKAHCEAKSSHQEPINSPVVSS